MREILSGGQSSPRNLGESGLSGTSFRRMCLVVETFRKMVMGNWGPELKEGVREVVDSRINIQYLLGAKEGEIRRVEATCIDHYPTMRFISLSKSSTIASYVR